jgi:hypothetical protein
MPVSVHNTSRLREMRRRELRSGLPTKLDIQSLDLSANRKSQAGLMECSPLKLAEQERLPRLVGDPVSLSHGPYNHATGTTLRENGRGRQVEVGKNDAPHMIAEALETG